MTLAEADFSVDNVLSSMNAQLLCGHSTGVSCWPEPKERVGGACGGVPKGCGSVEKAFVTPEVVSFPQETRQHTTRTYMYSRITSAMLCAEAPNRVQVLLMHPVKGHRH